ncbi:prenyltransferase [Candidatus Formimonas warabiya]|uniref:Prenyltransferase n=1 Tax=Formimonas warabiya TaxID=1761012 RepID=A0A3G1KZ28_FORW1|nr:prenyltransferase [Candidatus Formimonas warabiya]ATW27465.1 prenyltransferase [Candidatus Formimonas warabiya]
MAIVQQYQSDVAAILAKRYDNGADYWTTPDKRLSKGSPFSTLMSTLLLLELGLEPSEPLLEEIADLIFSTWREDGRFKLSPQGAIYPCHTINAANVLCHLGYATDSRLQKTFRHLFDIQHSDGGWRCNKFSFGRGPETDFSNPGPTLTALNVFRFTSFLNKEPALDRAVEFMLEHWTIRKPLGPCHYGMGTLFMQAEYPFGNYNLFIYLYVLSFYNRAKEDKRFHEAFNILKSKLVDGKIVVERVNPKLAGFAFCKKGEPSELGTKRYHEILENLNEGKESEIIGNYQRSAL